MAILVTGGAGYIGSHTCVELLDRGYDVIIVDNFSKSSRIVINRIEELAGKKVRVYELDLLDKAKLQTVFKENKIEAVIHFAAYKAVGESVLHPLKYYENNITSLLYICEYMKQYNVKKLVFSSSAAVYGVNEHVPIVEDEPLEAVSPYARTKIICEQMLHDFYQANQEFSITMLRYFNLVGAHKSGRIGDDPKGVPENLPPYISQVAVGKQKELLVFGADYNTIDGTGVRDYIHVTDLVLGHLCALEKMKTGIEAYNLGTGTGHSVLQLVQSFEQVTGISIPYKIIHRRPGDVVTSYCNPEKAERELGFKATRTIEEMWEDAWRWQSNNPNGYE